MLPPFVVSAQPWRWGQHTVQTFFNHYPVNVVSHPRRLGFLSLQVWEPKILQTMNLLPSRTSCCKEFRWYILFLNILVVHYLQIMLTVARVIVVIAYCDVCQFLIILQATVSAVTVQFSTLNQTAIFMDTWQLHQVTSVVHLELK